MNKKPPKPAVLPEIPEFREFKFNRADRQLLEGCLSLARETVLHHRQTGVVPKEQASKTLAHINRLSDQIMPEEEAARMLQDLGFNVVEKGDGN